MLKRVLSLLIVLTMVLSLTVGCTKPAPAPAPEGPSEETPGEEPAPEQPAGSSDFLVWNMTVDPQTWDPTLNSAVDGSHIINNIFDGLTRETPNGIEAASAESWEVSEDGMTYTFKLREGLKWSDGQPLTAKDFEYGWKRACDPATASEYSFIVTSYLVGGEEYFNGTGSRDEVGVKALDDTTLEVKLKFPVPYFLSLTSFPTYSPIREDIVLAKGEGWEKDPATCISNGPFKLTEYKTGSHITLEKNEHYWDAANIKLAGITGLMINEGTTALNGYEKGEIQVMDGITADRIPQLLKEDPNFKIYPQLGTYYIIFNTDDEVFNNPLVRKAFAIAIDRRQFVEQVTKGGQMPATGFLAPSLFKSDGTSFRQLDADGQPLPEYGIDPNKALVDEAKALLAEAGYPNGEGLPKLTFLYNTNDNNKKIAEALQGIWKQNLGIDVEIKNEDWAVFQETRRTGQFNFARGGWIGDYGDPMTLLDLFTSNSGNNDPQWRYKLEPVVAPHDDKLNPDQEAFDKAIYASREATGAERDKLLLEAEAVLMDNMVVAPLYWYTMTTIVDESVVEGVALTSTTKWDFRHAEIIR